MGRIGFPGLKEGEATTPPLNGSEGPGPPPRDELGATYWIIVTEVLRAVHTRPHLPGPQLCGGDQSVLSPFGSCL